MYTIIGIRNMEKRFKDTKAICGVNTLFTGSMSVYSVNVKIATIIGDDMFRISATSRTNAERRMSSTSRRRTSSIFSIIGSSHAYSLTTRIPINNSLVSRSRSSCKNQTINVWVNHFICCYIVSKISFQNCNLFLY